MEQNFQTSFIPKKPIIEEINTKKSSTGFLTVLVVLIFITMALTYGGLYFYQTILIKNIASKQEQLDTANKRFEISKINDLEVLDKRLKAGNKVLERHITISPIFKILQEITMKQVRYTKFSYEIEEKDKIVVKMSGLAIGYRYIALQADLFSANKNFIDPVFSNLTLDDKSNVSFDLTFAVDPSLVDYKQTLEIESPAVENTIPDLNNLNN